MSLEEAFLAAWRAEFPEDDEQSGSTGERTMAYAKTLVRELGFDQSLNSPRGPTEGVTRLNTLLNQYRLSEIQLRQRLRRVEFISRFLEAQIEGASPASTSHDEDIFDNEAEGQVSINRLKHALRDSGLLLTQYDLVTTPPGRSSSSLRRAEKNFSSPSGSTSGQSASAAAVEGTPYDPVYSGGQDEDSITIDSLDDYLGEDVVGTEHDLSYRLVRIRRIADLSDSDTTPTEAEPEFKKKTPQSPPAVPPHADKKNVSFSMEAPEPTEICPEDHMEALPEAADPVMRSKKRSCKTVHERLSSMTDFGEPSSPVIPASPGPPVFRAVRFVSKAPEIMQSTMESRIESYESEAGDDVVDIPTLADSSDLIESGRLWELRHILNDEKRHVEILNLMSKFANAFKSKVPSEQVDVVFFSVERMHDDLNQFVTALDDRVLQWTESTCITDLVEALIEKQSTIQSYVQNLPKAVKQFDEILANYPTFQNALEFVSIERKDVRLRDLIQQPAVWLTKTVENIKRIAERTPPGHSDYQPLQICLERMRETLHSDAFANKGNSRPFSEFDLGAVQRHLIRNSLMVELVANNVRKLRHVFLFTDLLVCAKQKLVTLHPSGTTGEGGPGAAGEGASVGGQGETTPWIRRISSFEVRWFIPTNTLVLYKVNDFEIDDVKVKRKAEIATLKNKIKQLKLDLRNEMKKLEGPAAPKEQFSFRKWMGPKKQIDKLKEQLVKLQGSLILLSPNLQLRVGCGSVKLHTLLMSSEQERIGWRESIQSLRSRELVRLPDTLTAGDVQSLLDQYKDMVLVNTIGSYLLSSGDDGTLTGILKTTVHRAEGLTEESDYYVCVEVDSFEHFDRVAKTKIASRTIDPSWEESFDIDLDCSQMARFIIFKKKFEQAGKVVAQLDLKLDADSLDHYIEKDHVIRTVDTPSTQILLTVSLAYTGRYQTLARQPSMWKEGLFGVTLEKVVKREKIRSQSSVTIPIIIQTCVAEIERRGLEEQGLYRVSGSSNDVQDLKKDFEKNMTATSRLLGKHDIHVVTGVLKSYLRELPDPLLKEENYRVLMDAVDFPSVEQKEKKIREILTSLPEPNLTTAIFLLKHFVKVSSYNAKNRMVVGNLGLIFGPTLLCPSSSILPCDILSVTMESMKQSKTLTQILIMIREGKLFAEESPGDDL